MRTSGPAYSVMSKAPEAVENVFRGFPEGTFAFFRELAENNHKAWFDCNRERYERDVKQVFQALLGTLEQFLRELNPHFETAGKVNRNFSRINRDIRFSKDKSPYKLNYYLYVFDGRRSREADGRLYVGLNADCITVGFATYASWRRKNSTSLETVFRKRVSAYREIFDGVLKHVVQAGHYETYWHRMEKGEWVTHRGLPRSDQDWQTLQAWVVRRVFPSAMPSLSRPKFAEKIRGIFAHLYSLYAFTSLAGRGWQGEMKRPLRL